MDPPDAASQMTNADTRREDGDQEMTDAPTTHAIEAPNGQYTESKFLPSNLDIDRSPSQPSQTPVPAANVDSNEAAIPSTHTTAAPETGLSASATSTTDKQSMAPSKKKGQASVKKAPKKPATSNASTASKPAKRSGGGKKKAPASAISNDKGSSNSKGATNEGDEEDDESDNGPYCICRGPDDHRFMIGCDICEDWFHGECINISKEVGENLIERFVCPNCADHKAGIQTLFKKTCSYRGCFKPARLYDDDDEQPKKKKKSADATIEHSVFCSDEHKQMWWERMIASLPRKSNVDPAMRDELTQEELVALLGSDLVAVDKGMGSYKVTTRPFAPPESEDDGGDTKTTLPEGVLTAEEESLLSTSAAERYKMGEEIVMCQKMLQLVDMASDRRKALIASKQLDDAACGYDSRLDSVGVQASFARFINTDEGREIFRADSLDVGNGDGSSNGTATAGVCDKKRCKPHQGWYAIHTRDVKYQMKLLAADAQKQLNREKEIRDAAVERALRKATEVNYAQYFDGEGNLLPRGIVPGAA